MELLCNILYTTHLQNFESKTKKIYENNVINLCRFETNLREECEEVSNVECKRINVTMYRPEIRERCRTSFDQSCNVTYKDVPTDKCAPRLRNR